jgi:hypothetical protein
MIFEELLDQAIDMLRRRGRVTYRARFRKRRGPRLAPAQQLLLFELVQQA